MLSRLKSDDRGAAAVEFALVAPLMFLMYCGLTEASFAFLAERRAAHTAAVVADLLAQPARMTPAQVEDVFNVATPLMRPFPADAMSMRVSNVEGDAQGVPKVVWSRARGMTPRAIGSVHEGLPVGYLAPGQNQVIAETTYQYQSGIGYVMPDGLTFRTMAKAEPRKFDVVLY